LVSLHLKFNDRGKDYLLTFSLKKWFVFPWALPKKEIFFYQEVSCGLTISFQWAFACFMYLKQLAVVFQGPAVSNSNACFCSLGKTGKLERHKTEQQEKARLLV